MMDMVSNLIITPPLVQDTSSVLQTLNDGSSSSFDMELYKRLDMQVNSIIIIICILITVQICAQLQVARINLHKIFFESSVTDKMGYIAHTRLLREEKAYKKPTTVPVSSMCFLSLLDVAFSSSESIYKQSCSFSPATSNNRKALLGY